MVERLHLVLVDNGGNTTLEDLDLNNFDAEILRTKHPLGFAAANNFALVHASRLGERILFLNQDTKGPPGWLDACLLTLDMAPRVGAVSPMLRTYDNDAWGTGFNPCLEGVRPEDLGRDGHFHETRHVPATAMVMPASVLLKAGPFDPLFESYYEDYDLCRRIRHEGYLVGFATRSSIFHYSGSASIDKVSQRRRALHMVRNRVIHRVREGRRPRWRILGHQVAIELPRRWVRGWVRGRSKPTLWPSVIFRAWTDLLRMAPRLLSSMRDRRQWQAYLDQIGWPPPTLASSHREIGESP